MLTHRNVSNVMCHVSNVACHMSRVTCQLFFYKVSELIGEGSVINGDYTVYFIYNFSSMAIMDIFAQNY